MASVFDEFTNIYSLSKTLRFELRPVGNTQRMLEEDNVIDMDKSREEAYVKTKPFLDELHRKFIKEALDGQKLEGLEGYYNVYKEFQKDKKNTAVKKRLDNMVVLMLSKSNSTNRFLLM